MSTPEAQRDFVDWLSANYPAVYEQAISGTTGMQGIFDTFSWDQFLKGVQQISTGYLAYKTDRQKIEINSDRAKAGCSPIVDWNAPAPPCTGSQVGSGNYGAAFGNSMDKYLPWLMIGGLGIAALSIMRPAGGSRRK